MSLTLFSPVTLLVTRKGSVCVGGGIEKGIFDSGLFDMTFFVFVYGSMLPYILTEMSGSPIVFLSVFKGFHV